MKEMNTEQVQCYWLGEKAVTLQAPLPVSLAHQQRIWAVADIVREQPGLYDVIPGMNNLTVQFEPLIWSGDSVIAALYSAWQNVTVIEKNARLIEIPVIYGGGYGPDLASVAAHTGMSAADVVRMHTEAEYTVFFIGFQPGFAYLGGMPEALTTPRHSSPRQVVPAGTVAIGGAQTGVYPKASPGGWQLIGRTDVVLFDPNRAEPSLWMPGDRVRFVASEVYL